MDPMKVRTVVVRTMEGETSKLNIYSYLCSYCLGYKAERKRGSE